MHVGYDTQSRFPESEAGAMVPIRLPALAAGGHESDDGERPSDPSTAPAPVPESPQLATAPLRHHDFERNRRREARERYAAGLERGEDTDWTMVTDTMATAWLAAFLLYLCGLLGMGTAAWRVAVDIPSLAVGQPGAPTDTGASDVPWPSTSSAALASSESPCGGTIPGTLIAIAFFLVLSAVLLMGWLPFFGLAVLPKLRAYRPGVGRIPFTFWSVFTPFVAYSTVVGLSFIAAAATCLYSLSITRVEDKFLEDICGEPFVTLRIVAIVFLGLTFVLLVAYGVHKYVLQRRAKAANREHQASQYSMRQVVY